MKLTIEQMREIVDGAPCVDMPIHYNTTNGVWVMTGYADRFFVDGEWKLLEDTNLGQFDFKTISINKLRVAIADHDRIDTCSDIKNHISPNTKVIDTATKKGCLL